MPTRRFTKLKAVLLENFWAPWAAAHLRRTIAGVQPDCIWVIPHDWSIFPLWRVMADGGWQMADGKTPRLHVTVQDYPDAHSHGAIWGMERAARMARMQEDIYRLATSRDATSHPMLEDLERRTGAKGFQMLHAGLEPEDFDILENPAISQTSSAPLRHPASVISSPSASTHSASSISDSCSASIRIAYAGTILVPREFALFVEALDSIRKHSSIIRPIELHLWGAHSYKSESWFEPDWMIERGNLPEHELLSELRKCDWGFIPMALSDTDPRYNRFSFPTKFITYLAAGLPIITMGHPESTVMKMANQYRVGLTISGTRIPVEEIADKLSDRDARESCRAEVLRCARNEFDAEKMRRRLHSCLAGAAMADGKGRMVKE